MSAAFKSILSQSEVLQAPTLLPPAPSALLALIMLAFPPIMFTPWITSVFWCLIHLFHAETFL